VDGDDDYLDGRARVAVWCAALAVLLDLFGVLFGRAGAPAFAVLFAAFALILAGSSILSVDEPASRRTRSAVAVGAGLGVLTLGVGVALLAW
jgi:hypothetical protein